MLEDPRTDTEDGGNTVIDALAPCQGPLCYSRE